MEDRQRLLGWIAIGLGLLALLLALGGRDRNWGRHTAGPPWARESVQRETDQQASDDYARGYMHGMQAKGGSHAGWHGGAGFFFRGLGKLLLFGLLLLLLLRALRRRKGSGGGGGAPPPAQSGPEPPYTGETQQL